MFAIRMPERENNELAGRNTVVDVVTDTVQVKPSDASEASVLDLLPDDRLEEKEFESALEVLPDCGRRCERACQEFCV